MKNTIPNAAIGGAPSASKPLLPPGPDAPAPIRYLGWLVDWTVLLIGATMATLIFVNVIVHNLFNGDVAWTTEFCELLMVWATFLGGAAATRRGAHMVVNELINHLHGTARRIADVCIQIVVLITLGLLFWYGLGIAEAGQMSTLTVLGWPMSSQYIALPVASLITMVFVGWDLTEILRGKSAEQRYGASQP